MALNKWGQLYVWGDNSHCQLGLRHELCPFSETPKLTKPLANYIIVQVQCGSHHNIALTNCEYFESIAWPTLLMLSDLQVALFLPGVAILMGSLELAETIQMHSL
jgi:hypothetical protein